MDACAVAECGYLNDYGTGQSEQMRVVDTGACKPPVDPCITVRPPSPARDMSFYIDSSL